MMTILQILESKLVVHFINISMTRIERTEGGDIKHDNIKHKTVRTNLKGPAIGP